MAVVGRSPANENPGIRSLVLVQLEAAVVVVELVVLLGRKYQPTCRFLSLRMRKGKKADFIVDSGVLGIFELHGHVYSQREPLIDTINNQFAVRKLHGLGSRLHEPAYSCFVRAKDSLPTDSGVIQLGFGELPHIDKMRLAEGILNQHRIQLGGRELAHDPLLLLGVEEGEVEKVNKVL